MDGTICFIISMPFQLSKGIVNQLIKYIYMFLIKLLFPILLSILKAYVLNNFSRSEYSKLFVTAALQPQSAPEFFVVL